MRQEDAQCRSSSRGCRLLVRACVFIYICLRVCLCFKALGEAPGCTLLSGVRWCWVWILGGCTYLLQNDIWGVRTPLYTCSRCLFCLCLAHNDAHTLTNTHHPRTPTPRHGVDNQLICYGAVRLVYEHMHDDELHCTRATTLFGETAKSRTQRRMA